MGSEWRKVRLGDVAERLTSGGTPSTKNDEYYGGEIPWLRTQEINFNRLYDTEIKITEEGLNNSSAKLIPTNSVIVAMYGATAGKSSINKIPLTTNQACCNIIVDNNKADYEYIYYSLLISYERLASLSNGAAQQNLSVGSIRDFEIPLPPLPIQRQIAAILSAFDDKIELNRRMNRTLEQMARALFKSWFVDFDPVRAKMRGEAPEGMDAETAALFPDELVEVEGREVPKGWEWTNLGRIAEITDCLHSKKPERVAEGYPYVQLNNIGEGGQMDLSEVYYISESDYKKWISRIEVQEDDCVITNVGRVGAVCKIPKGFQGAIGRNMTAIRLKNEFSDYPAFLIELLISDHMKSEITANTDAGTILNALNVKNIPKLSFILPKRPVLIEAENRLEPLREKIEQNLRESAQLARLRDALLPRLLAGDIDVSGWEGEY